VDSRAAAAKCSTTPDCRQGNNRDYGTTGVSDEELRKRLEALRIEHRDLDAAIDALTLAGSADQLQIARLKKRKLRLKDQIALIEDSLIPDIIA
jgi:hypothetical protein